MSATENKFQHNRSLFQNASPAILPSLLLCDFSNLEREVRQLEEAGVEVLHLDVMDGHFVPNLSYGMPIVESLRRITDLALDVHLMISEPAKYAMQFVRLVPMRLRSTSRRCPLPKRCWKKSAQREFCRV
jgi:hypothetical protein